VNSWSLQIIVFAKSKLIIL